MMKDALKRISTAIVLGSLFWLSFLYLSPFIFSLVLIGILIQILVFEWKNLFKQDNPLFWLLMPLYPILPFALLIILNHTPLYRNLLFILFIIISSLDMGGYVVGKLIGTHKIAPRISPGKTWEGFFGGYIFACIGLTFLLWEQNNMQPAWFILCFTMLICLLGLSGDLFESWLKRRARVKDSGDILPGHGGFLDRFDGILFAVFYFYIFKDYLVCIFG